MLYKGKAIEIIGEKEVFDQRIAWIRVLEDGSFLEVPYDELDIKQDNVSLPFIRYVCIAARIRDEVAQKKILAPYESSLLPLPHQILVLEKVMQSMQNRFLLADEVGMGKTIEAGLILKELKLRGEIRRTLAIVPKSSMLQWQSELKEHFNEVFHIYDSSMINSMARTFSHIDVDEEFNFWNQHNQIIVSTDALKPLDKRQGWTAEKVNEYNKYRIEAVLEADFDLIIIDEAHKMGGATPTVSRYVLAQELCNLVPNVLLLTATPHRGKSDHFRRILQLLDPDAFAGEGIPELQELEPYVIRTEKRLAIDYDGKKLFNKRETQRFDIVLDPSIHAKQIELYESVTEYVRRGFNKAKKTRNSATGLIMVLFQRIASSSTTAILSAMEGRLNRLLLGEEDSIDRYIGEDEFLLSEYEEAPDLEGLYQKNQAGVVKETDILEKLIGLAKDCLNTETDAKAEALIQRMQELKQSSGDPDLKFLVFTEYRSTQKMLYEFFVGKGFQCSYIHGGQDLDQRRTALIRFKNESQIMIATDAAGESLNMQFCHIVFNYDLPWNPMVIEQRVGRVDRIGQKNQVLAYNMLTNNSVDRRVYEIIEEKLSLILEQLGIDKTSDVLDSTIDMKKVNRLYLQSLLDPAKFAYAGTKWLNEIKNKLSEYQSTEGILPKVQNIEIEKSKAAEVKYSPLPIWLEHMVNQYVVTQNGEIRKNLFGAYDLKINGEGKKIAFDPELSLSHPDIEHLTLQHPFIQKILHNIPIFESNSGIPRIQSEGGEDTPGYWGLWEISAASPMEKRVQYYAFFLADSGQQFSAYALDIWNRLAGNQAEFSVTGNDDQMDVSIIERKLEPGLVIAYENLEAKIRERMETKMANKLNYFSYQRSRIEKIGIENIRNSKLLKLEKEVEDWKQQIAENQRIIPGKKLLLMLRLDG